MNAYTIAEAESQLSSLVDKALAGEEVTITRNGKPAVTLRPASRSPTPMTPEDVEALRVAREKRPKLTDDWVAEVRAMRDEER